MLLIIIIIQNSFSAVITQNLAWWSPDAKYAAIRETNKESDQSDIVIYKANDVTLIRLYKLSSFINLEAPSAQIGVKKAKIDLTEFAWSPDSKNFVFLSDQNKESSVNYGQIVLYTQKDIKKTPALNDIEENFRDVSLVKNKINDFKNKNPQGTKTSKNLILDLLNELLFDSTLSITALKSLPDSIIQQEENLLKQNHLLVNRLFLDEKLQEFLFPYIRPAKIAAKVQGIKHQIRYSPDGNQISFLCTLYDHTKGYIFTKSNSHLEDLPNIISVHRNYLWQDIPVDILDMEWKPDSSSSLVANVKAIAENSSIVNFICIIEKNIDKWSIEPYLYQQGFSFVRPIFSPFCDYIVCYRCDLSRDETSGYQLCLIPNSYRSPNSVFQSCSGDYSPWDNHARSYLLLNEATIKIDNFPLSFSCNGRYIIFVDDQEISYQAKIVDLKYLYLLDDRSQCLNDIDISGFELGPRAQLLWSPADSRVLIPNYNKVSAFSYYCIVEQSPLWSEMALILTIPKQRGIDPVPEIIAARIAMFFERKETLIASIKCDRLPDNGEYIQFALNKKYQNWKFAKKMQITPIFGKYKRKYGLTADNLILEPLSNSRVEDTLLVYLNKDYIDKFQPMDSVLIKVYLTSGYKNQVDSLFGKVSIAAQRFYVEGKDTLWKENIKEDIICTKGKGSIYLAQEANHPDPSIQSISIDPDSNCLDPESYEINYNNLELKPYQKYRRNYTCDINLHFRKHLFWVKDFSLKNMNAAGKFVDERRKTLKVYLLRLKYIHPRKKSEIDVPIDNNIPQVVKKNTWYETADSLLYPAKTKLISYFSASSKGLFTRRNYYRGKMIRPESFIEKVQIPPPCELYERYYLVPINSKDFKIHNFNEIPHSSDTLYISNSRKNLLFVVRSADPLYGANIEFKFQDLLDNDNYKDSITNVPPEKPEFSQEVYLDTIVHIASISRHLPSKLRYMISIEQANFQTNRINPVLGLALGLHPGKLYTFKPSQFMVSPSDESYWKLKWYRNLKKSEMLTNIEFYHFYLLNNFSVGNSEYQISYKIKDNKIISKSASRYFFYNHFFRGFGFQIRFGLELGLMWYNAYNNQYNSFNTLGGASVDLIYCRPKDLSYNLGFTFYQLSLTEFYPAKLIKLGVTYWN